MSKGIEMLRTYLPDASVEDARPAFDDDFSRPFFHAGNETGCLVLHGVGGTPANVRALSDALARRGYTVYAPTLPGHGETVRALNASTWKDWLACARAGYKRLEQGGCSRIFLLGLSLGGLLCGLLAEERSPAGLIIYCAPLRMQSVLRLGCLLSPLIPFVGYPTDGNRTKWQENPYAQMYSGLSTKKLKDVAYLSRLMRRNLSAIRCPTLWVSAERDDKVDPRSPEIFRRGAKNLPLFRRAHLADSGHGCTYGKEREKAAAYACSFMQDV